MTSLPFIYVTSAPFSGSTLLSFLVNSHPQIATVGEMTGIVKSQDARTYQCSCGERIRLCPFWKDVAKQMRRQGFDFNTASFDTRIQLGSRRFEQWILNSSMRSTILEDLRDSVLTLSPRLRGRLAYLISRNKALAWSILHVTGKSVFFDASKYPGLIRHLFNEPDVDLRIIHLVRDVRGACLSRKKNKGETDWPRSVRSWIRINRSIERQIARLPDNKWTRVRYEDLCARPEGTLQTIFRFCGVEYGTRCAGLDSIGHHIVGNRMRLTSVNEIKLDDAWRTTLSANEASIAVRLAGRMHARYGYDRTEIRRNAC